ncbi:MAG: FAD-dependent oxidoreductase, partial [Pyrinomonadaceae bacterium]|nr:FAD-dependent oxidoreductase [Pyrinomonadaceae bacterium]
MTSHSSQRWAVIGGGLLGMTLAHRLAKRGERVTLFEGADHLGGLASAWKLGDVVWDRHYHVTLLSDTALRSLLAEMGLEKEIEWVETRTGFYTGGNLYSMSNTLEFLRFPPLGPVGKLRLGATIFYASKVRDWQRLEKITVADWLRRWSGRSTFETIWLPLLRAKLGENYTKASAAFIWATIARMYAARRTGLKKEMFGYVPGGYARILE